MAAEAGSKMAYTDDQWGEMTKFITEVVEKHIDIDTTFIEKMAKALDEDVLTAYKVLCFPKYLNLRATIITSAIRNVSNYSNVILLESTLICKQ